MPFLQLLLLPLLLLSTAIGQDPGRVLSVATKVTPPFVTRGDDGYTGLSIELWRMVEQKMGMSSRFVERDLQTMLADTAAGKVDLAVAAITITAEREAVLEFSYPFLESGLGIATRVKEQGIVVAILDRLFSTDLLQALLALAIVLVACGILVWALERRRNPQQFGGKGLAGLGEGLWFSAVTMTTVGYGDKAPVTFGGRAVALVWMFTSVIIISSYTASIASALTVERMTAVVRGPQDLPTARIGSIAGSSAAQWLRDERLRFEDYADLSASMAALENGRIDAIVYDAPILRSVISEGSEIKVLPHVLRKEQYAFALPAGSALRRPLNRALLEVLESANWLALRQRYLGG